jgi:hypothetical protein
LYYCNYVVCCLFSVFTQGWRSLGHELLSQYNKEIVALGRSRTGFSELGRRFRSVEKPQVMTNTHQNEIITIYACEFVSACTFVGNYSRTV